MRWKPFPSPTPRPGKGPTLALGRWSRRPLAALAVLAVLLAAGCQPPPDSVGARRISWTGAPAPIERMIAEYLSDRGVPRELRPVIFPSKYYASPTPFFLFEGNDDAVTLALSARLGASYPPVDVFYIDLYWFKNFEREWLTSFQSMTIPVKNQLLPLRDAIPPSLRDACELQGELCAVPLSIRGNCLYYRTDLVETPPRTWPELVEVARRVLAARPAGGPLRHGIVFHWNELHNDVYPILWGYGGGPPSCLGTGGELDRSLADEANLDALDMFYRLVRVDCLAPPIDRLRSADLQSEKSLFETFAAGETVFLIDWTNRAARIAAELEESTDRGLTHAQIGIAPIPHGPDAKQHFSTIGSWGWVVASQPRSPHSIHFVRQLATPAAQLYFFEEHAEIPIFREDLLTSFDAWPRVQQRLNGYHRELLRLIHGDRGRPGVVLRDRPGLKEINRLVLQSLHAVLEMPPSADPSAPFDRQRAREILRETDLDIVEYLRRLERLGVDCSCPPAESLHPGPAVSSAAFP